MVGAGAGYEWQREARCVCGCRAESADRAERGESGTSAAISAISPDATKDTRLNAAPYAIGIAPDGAVWGTILGFPGGLVRVIPGANPPETTLTEYYEVPYNNPKAKVWAIRRAAWMWTATGWHGWRWAAAIWRASTGASVKAR